MNKIDMKTSLEDTIRTHRDAFDDQLPPEGHLERFVGKLYETEQRTWQWNTFRATLVAIAAVVAVVLVFHFAMPSSPQQEPLSEVEQISRYYNEQLQQQAHQIEEQVVKLDPQSREAIINEIRNIVASAQMTDPEYQLMTQPEQIHYTVRRYTAYQKSLQTIEQMLKSLLDQATRSVSERKPDA